MTRKLGNDICVRVHLRKRLGREPSQVEVFKIIENSKRLKAAKSALTWVDIAAAYEHGEEVRPRSLVSPHTNPHIMNGPQEIRVYAMKCVGYDAQFQIVLARNYKKFSPPKQKSKSMGGNAKSTAKERKRKRDRSATPEGSDFDGDVPLESEESEEDDGGDDDGDRASTPEEPQYIPRPSRTRTRAIAKRTKLQ